MSISSREVEKISLLARLRLSPEELVRMTAEMGQILHYMELLNEAQTDQVQAMAHPVDITDVFRDDLVQASLSREQALANAPHRDEECYRVPAVLGDV